MKTAIIISLNFRVAHTSHLIASYKQMEEIGYKSILLVSKDLVPFLPPQIDYVTTFDQIEQADVAIFWFPAFGNLSLMRKFKHHFNSKIIYVFHEPIESFKTYREYGLSCTEIAKVYARYLFNLLLVNNSDAIILPSQKAIRLYEHSLSNKVNSKYYYVPLMFDDEASNIKAENRMFFSYIGTISEDHAFDIFLEFIIKASTDLSFPEDINFLIATRNKIDRSKEITKLEKEGRLVIIDGKPLTDHQINEAYAKSFLVWNAYHRTTQSGVLAKASMFGTPAIIQTKNISEFTITGKNVIAITDNKNYDQIKTATIESYLNFNKFSNNSRQLFLDTFYYRCHNRLIESIIEDQELSN